MARVLTNNVTLQYAPETTFKAQPTTAWQSLEPNAINTYGASITTVPRDPISANRQRRKGVVTDLDSAVEFEADITQDLMDDFMEAFLFATAVNNDMDISVSNVDGTANEYDVSALTAGQAGKLDFSATEYASLIYARGFSTAANNGLKALDATVASMATAIGVTDTALVDETPPANARVELAGLRFLAGNTDVAWTYSSGVGTLTISNIMGFDFTAFGLTVGQFVHFGSPDSSGAVQNAFENASANDQFGYARITAITATTITFDKLDTALQNDSPTVPATVDMMFGKFIRNVARSDSAFLERSYHFELTYPDLASGPADAYEYAAGNFCNTIALNMPLTDKATATLSFIGTDTQPPTTSRATGASSATASLGTTAVNTSSDFARLRITDTDETGLTTDFKSLTVTINNNVSPEKVLNVLGAQFMNTGNFEIDIEAQIVFTSETVLSRIRNNTTVTMEFGFVNDDFGIILDVPSMTLGGGGREFPVNESVLANLSGIAFQDPTLGTSLSVSFFPTVPTS